MFESLLFDILNSVLGEWIDVTILVQLDSACTNHKIRNQLLECMRSCTYSTYFTEDVLLRRGLLFNNKYSLHLKCKLSTWICLRGLSFRSWSNLLGYPAMNYALVNALYLRIRCSTVPISFLEVNRDLLHTCTRLRVLFLSVSFETIKFWLQTCPNLGYVTKVTINIEDYIRDADVDFDILFKFPKCIDLTIKFALWEKNIIFGLLPLSVIMNLISNKKLAHVRFVLSGAVTLHFDQGQMHIHARNIIIRNLLTDHLEHLMDTLPEYGYTEITLHRHNDLDVLFVPKLHKLVFNNNRLYSGGYFWSRLPSSNEGLHCHTSWYMSNSEKRDNVIVSTFRTRKGLPDEDSFEEPNY